MCANRAFSEIDGSGGRITGRGMAQAGNILGWIGVALCVLGLIVFSSRSIALVEGSTY